MNKQTPQNHNPKKNPCHICGSQKFIWGRSFAPNRELLGTSCLYFLADTGSWRGGEKLRARKCSNCDNVQLFADFAKEKAAQSGIVV